MIPTLLCSLVLGFVSDETVSVEPLSFNVEALKKMEVVELRLMERGATSTYRGVPLRVVLEGPSQDAASMARLRALADSVLLVRATDGYQVAVSAVAVAMDPKGERYLLAWEHDGKPLGDAGPIRLVVPGDPQHVRWIRNVSGIDLIRLPKSKAPVKAAETKRR
jgi:DMSO/TMAO reductase YedYZ molybdopterin-dependent catalytic subunit